MNDEQADQVVQCLVGIAAELTAIRQELQRYNDRLTDQQVDLETFDCRCGERLGGEPSARRHALDDHGAPRDTWRELYS